MSKKINLSEDVTFNPCAECGPYLSVCHEGRTYEFPLGDDENFPPVGDSPTSEGINSVVSCSAHVRDTAAATNYIHEQDRLLKSDDLATRLKMLSMPLGETIKKANDQYPHKEAWERILELAQKRFDGEEQKHPGIESIFRHGFYSNLVRCAEYALGLESCK